MPFRLVGAADDQIDKILQESETDWGLAAASRYGRLILAAMTAIGESPALPGSYRITGVPGVRALHLRLVRRLIAREQRVAEPRHLVVYRVAPDGIVEILDLVHDRQLLARAARRAQRQADV